MTKVGSIYIEVKGDSTQFAKDMSALRSSAKKSGKEVSDALNNAISPQQATRGISTIQTSLKQLAQTAKVPEAQFKVTAAAIARDLGGVAKSVGMTEKEFANLNERMLRNQAMKQAETSLRGIANSAGLSSKEIRAMAVQMGYSSKEAEKMASSIRRTSTNTNTFSTSIGNLLKTMVPIISGVMIVRGIQRIGGEFLETADKMAKLSQATGVTVETLSSLSHAAELSGVTVDNVANGLKRLSNNMMDTAKDTGEAKDAFAALGISVLELDGNLKTSEQVMKEVASQFAGMEDGAGKTALAMKLFGKAGAEMIPLLNQGAEGISAMQKEAEKLGITLDTKTAQQAERINDQFNRIGKTFKGVGYDIMTDLLPHIESTADAIFDWTQENKELINTKIQDFIEGIGSKLPGIASGLSDIAETTGKIIGLYNSLPSEVVGAAGAGVLGRILMGNMTGAAFAAAVSAWVSAYTNIKEVLDKNNAEIAYINEELEKLYIKRQALIDRMSGGYVSDIDKNKLMVLNQQISVLEIEMLNAARATGEAQEAMEGAGDAAENFANSAKKPPPVLRDTAKAAREAEKALEELRKEQDRVQAAWDAAPYHLTGMDPWMEKDYDRLTDAQRKAFAELDRLRAEDTADEKRWNDERIRLQEETWLKWQEEAREAYEKKQQVEAGFTAFVQGQIQERIDAIGTEHDITLAEWAAYYDAVEGLMETSSKALGQTFKTVFSDFLRGELRDFEDYWKSFLNSLLNAFIDFVANLVAAWARARFEEMLVGGLSNVNWLGGIGDMLGGGSGSSSGGGIGSGLTGGAALKGLTWLASHSEGTSTALYEVLKAGYDRGLVAADSTVDALASAIEARGSALGQGGLPANNISTTAYAPVPSGYSSMAGNYHYWDSHPAYAGKPSATPSGAGQGSVVLRGAGSAAAFAATIYSMAKAESGDEAGMAGVGGTLMTAGAASGNIPLAIIGAVVAAIPAIFNMIQPDKPSPEAWGVGTAATGIQKVGEVEHGWDHYEHLIKERWEGLTGALYEASERFGVDLSDSLIMLHQTSYDVLGSSLTFLDQQGNALVKQGGDFTDHVIDGMSMHMMGVSKEAQVTMANEVSVLSAVMVKNLEQIPEELRGMMDKIEIDQMDVDLAQGLESMTRNWANAWDKMDAATNIAIANYQGHADHLAGFGNEMIEVGTALTQAGDTMGTAWSDAIMKAEEMGESLGVFGRRMADFKEVTDVNFFEELSHAWGGWKDDFTAALDEIDRMVEEFGLSAEGAAEMTKQLVDAYTDMGHIMTEMEYQMAKTQDYIGPLTEARIAEYEAIHGTTEALAGLSEAEQMLIETTGSLDDSARHLGEQLGYTDEQMGALGGEAGTFADRLTNEVAPGMQLADSRAQGLAGSLGGAAGALGNFGAQLGGLRFPTVPTYPATIARASGGPVSKDNMYLVGEQGPEIVAMSGSGYVHNATETARMLGLQGMAGGGSFGRAPWYTPERASDNFGKWYHDEYYPKYGKSPSDDLVNQWKKIAELTDDQKSLAGITATLRSRELRGMDEAAKALQRKIWLLEDEKEAQEEADDLRKMEIELMKAQGKEGKALLASREMELQNMSKAEKAIQKQIWAWEDLAENRSAWNEWQTAQGKGNVRFGLPSFADERSEWTQLGSTDKGFVDWAKTLSYKELQFIARSMGTTFADLTGKLAEYEQYFYKVEGEKLSLQMRRWELEGNETKMMEVLNQQRERELATLDPSLRGLQKRVWALEDEQEALKEAEQAAAELNSATEQYVSNLISAADNLLRARKDLWLGATTPLSIVDLYRAQGAEINDLLRSAKHGNLDQSLAAMSELPGMMTSYLGTTRQMTTDPRAYAREVARASLALESTEYGARKRSESEDLKDEVIELRQEVAAMSRAVSRHTSDTARILERWEFGGMPEART